MFPAWALVLTVGVGLQEPPRTPPAVSPEIRQIIELRRKAADLTLCEAPADLPRCDRKLRLLEQAEALAADHDPNGHWVALNAELDHLRRTISGLRKAAQAEAAGGAKADKDQQAAQAQADEAVQDLLVSEKCDAALAKLEAARALDPQNATVARYLPRARRCVETREKVWRWATRGGVALGVALLAAIVVRFKQRRRRLEVVDGPERGRVVKLDKNVVALGAVAEAADCVLSDPYRKISRRHCEIARSGRHFFVVDVSRNGTFLNGRALPKNEPVLLRRNDELTLGDDIVLVFK
jgi:hypothetical protein